MSHLCYGMFLSLSSVSPPGKGRRFCHRCKMYRNYYLWCMVYGVCDGLQRLLQLTLFAYDSIMNLQSLQLHHHHQPTLVADLKQYVDNG